MIGANPTAETLAYGQRPGIKIVGRVPSMPVALNQAQLAVAPMQIGSGMQSKILEAMACGLPMVCTPFCIEPIGARPGHEVLAAQEPAAFAEACIELLRNEDKCLEISRNATAFIAREYGNEANARELVGLYRQVIDRQNG